MNVSEWQDRLEKYFTVNGIIGGKNLLSIFEQELKYGEYIDNTFFGYRVLTDSFFSFFFETIQKSLEIIETKGWPSNYQLYAPTILYYITIFRRFRAAENLLIKGYPLDGYSLLRDIKDRSIFLAAILHGITSFHKFFSGFDDNELNNIILTNLTKEKLKEKLKKLKSKRKNEESKILKEMIRSDSGLSSEILSELERWKNLFHEEVHGSKLTFATELQEWLIGKKPLSIGPVPIEKSYAMYMNRSSEVGWLFLRLFPFLQIEPHLFGKEWAEKWNVLDDSFRFMVEALSRMGKEIGKSFISFIDIKFPFTPETCYHENYNYNLNKSQDPTNIPPDST